MILSQRMRAVRIGIALTILTLLFGIGMGILFGVNEDLFKDWISAGIAAYPGLHDAKSSAKIWRYAQRAHFHAVGIGAFTLGLVILVALSGMKERLKSLTAILIGLGGLYPLAWFSMFLLSPSMGRGPAHGAFITELFVYVGVLSLLSGMGILIANLFFSVGDDTTLGNL